MLPDKKYPSTNCGNELKISQNRGHKFKHNVYNQLPQISEIYDKSLKSANNRNVLYNTLVTNDERQQQNKRSNKDWLSSHLHHQYQQQLYIEEDIDDDNDGYDCSDAAPAASVVKVMNTEEFTMPLTGRAPATGTSGIYNDDSVYNEQYEAYAAAAPNICYSNIHQQQQQQSTDYYDYRQVRVPESGEGYVGNEATASPDDANNHSNSDDRRQQVTATQHNNNDDKQNLDTATAIVNNNSNLHYKKYHKVSHKTIDSDDAVEDTGEDHRTTAATALRRSDETDVVDNCNVDNVKYNEHHKTFAPFSSSMADVAAKKRMGHATSFPCQTTTSATKATPQYMSLNNIKQEEYVAEKMAAAGTPMNRMMMPTLMTPDIPFPASFQNSENHKIQSHQPIHQTTLSSLPLTSSSSSSTFDFMQQSYHAQHHHHQNQYYHQQRYQELPHHLPSHHQQYFPHHQQQFVPNHHHGHHHNDEPSLQQYMNVAAASSQNVFEKNYGLCSTGGVGGAESSATTSLTICELASPRCQSRESNASISGNNEARCPSNESHYSVNDTHTSGQTPTPTTPPVGLPLPATLPPAAAAALLPPQSAAMAAYFNAAAAAAAQQNHLLLTNPLAAAASLVQQASQQQQQQQSSHSPNSQQASTPTPPAAATTGDMVDTSALDFSTKRSRRNSNDYGNASDDGDATGRCADEDGSGGAGARNDNEADNTNDNETDDVNSPLDLSLNNGRKRQSDESEEPVMMPHRKLARSNDYKSLPASSTWVPPINPYLAAVAAASMSPKTPLSLDWNAKTKISPNEATKALEKMTEMTRLGAAAPEQEAPTRHSANSVSSNSSSGGTPSNGRHSAWQSHWLNKGADAVKDVFKCVWCKQSFATLASLTTHMKETQHCGVNVPPTVAAAAAAANAAHPGGNQAPPSSHHARHSSTQPSNAAHSPASSGSKSDLNMLIKETMPLPRKLVRGQDVWLGKGAEQTRQILKCMWCGQSFRSLAEMTSHMQETQHYTNIISQEQIISWKSTDDKGSRDNSSCGSSNRGCPSTNSINTNAGSTAAPSPNPPTPNANPTVTAVLTCKVCDQAFPTLKELSSHMMKNNHYTEHMMRSNAPAAPSPAESAPTMIRSRSRQGKEKRKKSLPVRKLLEMERAQQDFKASNMEQALTPLREFKATTKLQCETCGEKFGLEIFVEHIRQCIAMATERSMQMERSMNVRTSNEDILKSTYLQPPMVPEFGSGAHTPASRSDSRKTVEENASPLSTTGRADIICPLPSDSDKSSSGTSVLNALEQLIEKSFDARPRHAAAYGEGSSIPLGSSILKRLGIDDNVDYTKPLMDPQTMQFLRSYSSYAPSSRDRSASESSSISERCSSRLESFTPERNFEQSRQPTPRLTPDKYPQNTKESSYPLRIKSEPMETTDQSAGEGEHVAITEVPKKISVKKEFSMTDETEEYTKAEKETERGNSLTPGSRSPSISERSITPKSVASVGERKPVVGLPESSSLSALSSMFNNLSNMHSHLAASANNLEMNNNNNNNTATATTPKKSNANPLAALQKLCDTNEKPAANARSSSVNLLPHSASPNSSSNGTNAAGGGGGGAAASAASGNGSSGMLAFSWACNDAIVTADSIIKCSFCDTPFSSKGAYRHHLSKVHFVKEEPDVISLKSPSSMPAASPKSQTTSPKSLTSSRSPASQRPDATPPSNMNAGGHAVAPPFNPYDESPQSKFLKYTELAKQLSSKNA